MNWAIPRERFCAGGDAGGEGTAAGGLRRNRFLTTILLTQLHANAREELRASTIYSLTFSDI
jgi:hypothetical protein